MFEVLKPCTITSCVIFDAHHPLTLANHHFGGLIVRLSIHNRLKRQTSVYPQRPTMLRLVGQQVINTAAILVCIATLLVDFKKRMDLIGIQGAQRVWKIAHVYDPIDPLC